MYIVEFQRICSLNNTSGHHMLAGVEHIGGDMYASVPLADAIFMRVTLATISL